jgi:hypothetical protein
MFAYNPQVNDRSGEIYGAHQVDAAKAQAAGMQSFGKSIGDGLQSAGSSIAGGVIKHQENAAKMQGAQSTVQAMQDILPQYGKQGIALGDALAKSLEKAGNNPDKISGTIMAYQPAMQSLIQTDHSVQVANAQGANYQALAQIKADAQAAQPPKMNVETIRAYANEAATNGATPDQIKAALLQGYGSWAVDAVYPQPKQNFWGP